MASRFSKSTVVTVPNYHDGSTVTAFPLSASAATASAINNDSDFTSVPHHRDSEFAAENSSSTTTTTMAYYLPHTSFFKGLHHDAFELELPKGPSDSDLVSKWRPKDKIAVQSGIAASGIAAVLKTEKQRNPKNKEHKLNHYSKTQYNLTTNQRTKKNIRTQRTEEPKEERTVKVVFACKRRREIGGGVSPQFATAKATPVHWPNVSQLPPHRYSAITRLGGENPLCVSNQFINKD
ncbi:regulatory-associated protein of TOR [Trifolium pratense]|uniref:Regulatory-associated protein of TOR n=1 Tax=Trifolium pratense TaxID=57577 RepID=A0A2K3NKY5_TRIPR|nr:regulatory-associated protein of TOR [Trifolium pratense]